MTLLLAVAAVALSLLIGRRAQRDLDLARHYRREAELELDNALIAYALAYRQNLDARAQVEEFTA